MVATKLTALAAVLLATKHVSALGAAVIQNQCPFEVYLWSVSNVGGSMQTLSAHGGQYSETYRVNPDGGGISIKMGADPSCSNITQYEYTLDNNALWYDLSNINGYPFAKYGVTVVPSDSSCRGVVCPAGTPLCAAAYNIPSDNFATAECGSNADSVVVLCSGATDTDSNPSISSVASQAASTATPVSTVSTAPSTPTPATTTVAKTTPASTHSTHHAPTHHSVAVEVASAAAAPAVTAAPAPPAAAPSAANPFVVVHTTFVTHVVTVVERNAEPTAAAEIKRDVHHEHAAVHQEHPARRHQHPRAFK